MVSYQHSVWNTLASTSVSLLVLKNSGNVMLSMVTAKLDSIVPASVELWMLSTFLGEHPFGSDLAFHQEQCAPESNKTRNGFLVSVFCMLSVVQVVIGISSPVKPDLFL